MEQIGSVLGQNETPSTQKPESWQTPRHEGSRKSSRPPLVIPIKMPMDLARGIFSPQEYDSLLELLEIYLKKRPEWDIYRAKIPEFLLKKYRAWLSQCYENGFLLPYVDGNEIHWHQIVSSKRKFVDRCTTCRRTIIDRSCRGFMRTVNGNRDFVPCWRKDA